MVNGEGSGSSFVIGGVNISNSAIAVAGLVILGGALIGALSGKKEHKYHGGHYHEPGDDNSHEGMRMKMYDMCHRMAKDPSSVSKNKDRVQNHIKRNHGMNSDLRRQLVTGHIDDDEFNRHLVALSEQTLEDLDIPH
jgi:hypothetical protein